MTNEEMLALKKGDQVLYDGLLDSLYNIESGHLLTRSENWMDDDHSVLFSYVIDGIRDRSHFFCAKDIKFKE